MGSYPKIKKFQKLSHVNDTFGPSLNLLLLYFMCRAMSNKHLLLHEGVILCAHWEDVHLLDQKVKVTSIYDITLHNFITMFHNVCFILFKISVIFFFQTFTNIFELQKKMYSPTPIWQFQTQELPYYPFYNFSKTNYLVYFAMLSFHTY